MLQKIPKIPADTEPTSHQFILMDWIRGIAATAFPKSVPAPRNPYITREIVLQIRERNKHSAIKSWHNSCIEDSVVRAAFKYWAKKWPTLYWNPMCGFINPRSWRALGQIRYTIHEINTSIKTNVKNNKINWLSKKGDGIKAAMISGAYSQILKVISDSKPREARQQLAIKDEVGNFAVNATGTQNVFKNHFKKLLVGKEATMAEIISEDTSKQILRFASGRGWRTDPTQAPGRSALQAKLCNTRVKALGAGPGRGGDL
jgi:hypothetical protein